MKTFDQYLLESDDDLSYTLSTPDRPRYFKGYPAWSMKRSAFVFGVHSPKHKLNKKASTSYDLYFPLPISEKVPGTKLKTITGKHTTDANHIQNIIMNQGENVHLSVASIRSGVDGYHTGGGIKVIVTGELLASNPSDFMNMPDDGGKRWIPVDEIEGQFTDKLFYAVSDAIMKWRCGVIVKQNLLRFCSPRNVELIKKIASSKVIPSSISKHLHPWTSFNKDFKKLYIQNKFKNKPQLAVPWIEC